MKRFILSLSVALLMAGCASSVKLDDVPVEDRAGSSVASGAGANASAEGGVVGKNGVASVDLGNSAQDAAMTSVAARTIYFDYDSFVIKPEFQALIEKQANYIKADRNRRVAIEGHTDERGGREYNLALGQKRAEAVRRVMGLLGVGDGQVEAVSFGKEKPAVQGSDEAAMSKNRRAEITYR
jgi:peptidoglycan-associated lipoprotein